MTADTEQFGIKIAMFTLAGITILSVLGLFVYAVIHDGQVANEMIAATEGYLQTAIYALAALTGVRSVATAFVMARAKQPVSSTSADVTSNSSAASVTAPVDGGLAQ